MKTDFLNMPGETLQSMIDNAPTQEEIEAVYERSKNKFKAECIKKIQNFPWEFESFDDPDLKAMESAVKHFCFDYMFSHLEDSDITPYWLTIIGKSELGKSHLTQRIIVFLQSACDGLRFPIKGASSQSVPDVDFKFLKASKFINDASTHKSKFRTHAADPEVIVFDDIHQGMSNWEKDDCCNFLMMRSGEGLQYWKWTVITTNMTRSTIAKSYDTRIASRIRRENNLVIELSDDITAFKDR